MISFFNKSSPSLFNINFYSLEEDLTINLDENTKIKDLKNIYIQKSKNKNQCFIFIYKGLILNQNENDSIKTKLENNETIFVLYKGEEININKILENRKTKNNISNNSKDNKKNIDNDKNYGQKDIKNVIKNENNNIKNNKKDENNIKNDKNVKKDDKDNLENNKKNDINFDFKINYNNNSNDKKINPIKINNKEELKYIYIPDYIFKMMAKQNFIQKKI